MKKLIFAILIICAITINAQMHNTGNIDPDSLTQITVSGTVSVEENSTHYAYYLDENSDGSLDYNLNFGPYWYLPDSSVAERPRNGDIITVTGLVHDDYNMAEQTIIVLKINGEFWRDPNLADWNELGHHSHQMGDHHDGMMGYGFGWEHDTIIFVEISGTTFVDTTFFMNNCQLDIDGDSYPDYHLNFGPYWYEPESGIIRPISGDYIQIKGGIINTSMSLPMVIVYEINGEIWRDSSSIGLHFGGGWFHRDLSDSQTFHSPFDMYDQMTIRGGWNGEGGHGHMGGMNNYDSLFCQILEVYPENIPNITDNVFAGYEINMFNSDGTSLMNNDGMMGHHMQFSSKVKYQMHYTDEQLMHYGADENSILAKYWDDQTNSWVELITYRNTELNIIKFESNVVSNFVVLEFSEVTNNRDGNNKNPDRFSLSQNYPNPFNPATTIKYSIPLNERRETSNVKLIVYDILGREVATLVNQNQQPGNYKVVWNGLSTSGGQAPSGVYFYKLIVGEYSLTKKLILMK